MDVRGRSSVSTAVSIYPQMSDRCYTDFHLFQIRLASVDYLFSTEDTDGHGWGLTKTITKTFNGGCVVSASGRGYSQECPVIYRNFSEIIFMTISGYSWKFLTRTQSALRIPCVPCDYLSADVRQMLYGFSSVSNLFRGVL